MGWAPFPPASLSQMRARKLLLAAAVLAAACDTPPVAWNDPTPIDQPPGATRLIVDDAGHAHYTAPSAAAVTPPPAPGMCAATLATTAGKTRTFAGWWRVRPDSSAALVVASSPDSGRTWGTALPVDTTDISSLGCTRPPPAITAVGDDVYVAYSMIAPEGKGVFFAHSMGSMLHSPVPVIYGERLVATAIAADAERVAIAYEDPNGRAARIDVALSMTQGHLFETHTTASRSVDDAVSPAVAMNDSVLAVSWLSRAQGAASERVVRIGRMPGRMPGRTQ